MFSKYAFMHNIMDMRKNPRPLDELVTELRLFLEERRVTQQEAAKLARISQSTVSRILHGTIRRKSKSLSALCKYARVKEYTNVPVDPAKNEALMEALRDTWDGSTRHASALARVIRSLGNL